jgi:hypothetical protein
VNTRRRRLERSSLKVAILIDGDIGSRLRSNVPLEDQDDDEEEKDALPTNRDLVARASLDHAGNTFSVAHQRTHIPNDKSSVASWFDCSF